MSRDVPGKQAAETVCDRISPGMAQPCPYHRFIALDDVRSFKNHDNRRTLDADPAYRCVARSRWLRNGFAVYERADEPADLKVVL